MFDCCDGFGSVRHRSCRSSSRARASRAEFSANRRGLYLLRDSKFIPDADGDIKLKVFSQQPIDAGEGYSFELEGVPQSDLPYEGGEIGPLRALSVTMNCTDRTYEVMDLRRLLPAPLWRPASTLPALAPLFEYVCSLS
jgi:hypothetical protein